MFFGLELKHNQNQAKPVTISKAIKLTQAVLDCNKPTTKGEPVKVYIEHNKKQFILCILEPGTVWQCPMDLILESDSQIKFFIKGSGTVHLTGYEVDDDLDSLSMDMSDDAESLEEEQIAKSVPHSNKVTKSPKNKANGTPKSASTNGIARKPSFMRTDYDEESSDEDYVIDDMELDGENEDDLDIDDDDDDEEDEDDEDGDDDEDDDEDEDDEDGDDDDDDDDDEELGDSMDEGDSDDD